MSILSTELVIYNAANMPVDDVSTCGGAIDTLRRPDFTQIGANDTIDIVSTAAGDTTQTVTIKGRKADGTFASETISLNGTTAVTTSNTYERILQAELSATCAGTVTVKRHTGGATVRVIPIGERGFQAFIQQVASSASATVDVFAKVFIKNTNGSLALTSSVVKENADPSGLITFALAAALDDTGSTANRKTSPGLTFDNTTKNVPNSGNLSSGSAIGVWADLSLAISNAALRTTWTVELDGNTT